MQLLKQSTAATVLIGPFVDNTDGYTPETGLAAGTVDEIGVYKHDATALTSISGTTTFTHRAGGMYTATLSSTDTGTLGRLTLYVRDNSVCLPVWKDFMVVPANAFDSIVLGSDILHADVQQWSGATTTVNGTTSLPEVDVKAVSGDTTAANNLELDYDGTGYAKANSSISLTSAQKNSIADHVLRRQWANAAASADGDAKAFRSLLGASAKIVNKVAIVGDTLTIYEADDTTSLGTQTVATNASANPITSIDTV